MTKEFDESKVNRDKIGRFATSGTKGHRQNTNYGEISNEKPKAKTKDEFFGVEYKGVKGLDAVEKLLKEKQGHVKAAFHRKEIGDIDLVWGDEKGGLAHAIKRRDIMRSMGTGTLEVIANPTWTTFTELAVKILIIILSGFTGYKMGYENITIYTVNYISDQIDLFDLFDRYLAEEDTTNEKTMEKNEGGV